MKDNEERNLDDITDKIVAGESLSEEAEEKIDDNEKEFITANEILDGFGLEWTFRSVRYVMDKEKVTFAQLRSCVYASGDGHIFDVLRSCEILIKAGLVGSKQVESNDAQGLTDKAYEIMDTWAEEGLHFSILHLLMINVMEKRHFFMGNRDVSIVKHCVSRGLQKDLATRRLIEDTQIKASQIQAYVEK